MAGRSIAEMFLATWVPEEEPAADALRRWLEDRYHDFKEAPWASENSDMYQAVARELEMALEVFDRTIGEL